MEPMNDPRGGKKRRKINKFQFLLHSMVTDLKREANAQNIDSNRYQQTNGKEMAGIRRGT